MANISSINGNPILALSDPLGYRITNGSNKIVMHEGKYATYGGTPNMVQLANVNGYTAFEIDVENLRKRRILVTVYTQSSTYNLGFVVADEDGVRVASVTGGAGNTNSWTYTLPTNASTLYVNSYNGKTVIVKYAEDLIDAVILSQYGPIFTYDAIAKELVISNRIGGSVRTFYVWHDIGGRKEYLTVSSEVSQTIENIYSGLLYYDADSNTFRHNATWRSNRQNAPATTFLVAEFVNGRIVSDSEFAMSGSKDRFQGKKLYCYGDSLTWYDGNEATWGPHEGEVINGYESYIRAYLNMTVVNRGYSGETTPQIISNLTSHDITDADMLSIMGGNNDDRLSVPIGSILPYGSEFNENTVIGALQKGIEYVLANNPTCKLFLMTEPLGWTGRSGELIRVDDDYPTAYRNVAAYYGLPLLDLRITSGVNEATRNTMYLDPPDTENTTYMYHPSNDGWRVISERIVAFIKNL